MKDLKSITIDKDVVDEIVRQARRQLPDEACGYLLGKGTRVTAQYPMTNADHSPRHFSFVPREQFEAVRFARKERLDVVGNWHSHPASPSRPSDEDIRLAYDPDILYFILSIASDTPVLNAFRITGGNVERLELLIVA